jgi:hypothetical protein
MIIAGAIVSTVNLLVVRVGATPRRRGPSADPLSCYPAIPLPIPRALYRAVARARCAPTSRAITDCACLCQNTS